MPFKYTTAITKMRKLRRRKRVIQGGTWAGKTYGIIAYLIDYAARHPRKKILTVAETIPAVKDGAVNNFKDIMQETGRWVESRWNATELKYTFANGSVMRFKAFDTEGKAKASGKWHVVFINESNHVPFPVANTLMFRAEDFIIFDFNPDNEFYVHTEILPNDDAEFLLLKYTDNEACPEPIKRDLEQAREKAKTSSWWANWCKVYIDGEVGQLQGTIFTNWKQIKEIPKEAELLGLGIDFGYSGDPAAVVEVWKWNGKYIYNEIVYEAGLLNNHLAARIKHRKNVLGYADSAEPKSIDELKQYGANVTATDKGGDSVNFGIGLMQQEEFYVTETSRNMIKELRKYAWATDKDGNALGVPVDKDNHAIDAARYWHLGRNAQFKVRKKYEVY